MQDTLQKLDLTLYCKNSSSGEYVKMILLEQSKEVGYKLNINQVEDTDAYIKESIESIPAIKIGSEVRCKGNLDTATFASQINEWILGLLNFGAIYRLLVPIDYSDQSEKAVDYAGMLSKYLKSYVVLTHVYHPTYIEAEQVPMISDVIEQQQRDRLEEYSLNIKRKWALSDGSKKTKVETHYVMGFPADRLIDLSHDDKPSLIIMGTTGSTGVLKNIFGSVSTKVAGQAKCPVILVPPDANIQPIKKMAYCSDDVDLDVKVIDQLLNIARPFKAEIHVLHYTAEEDDDYLEINLLNSLKMQYPKELIRFSLIQGKPSSTEINAYAIRHDLDLIAVSRGSRGIVSRIFHKSLTVRLAIDGQLPLLFLHKKIAI